MALKIDFSPAGVTEWDRTESGVTRTRKTGYAPTIYVGGREAGRTAVQTWAAENQDVVATRSVRKFTSLHADERSPLLALDLRVAADPQSVARRIRTTIEFETLSPGALRLYNVDLSPQFRYCLEADVDPTPTAPLETLSITLDERSIADRNIGAAQIDDEPVDGGEAAVLERIETVLDQRDPDVLIVNAAALVPLVHERALAHGRALDLGRDPGWKQLAGENTFESYGKVGHSAARYDVPGRVVINTSNSFLWAESSLAGLCYLVSAARKPLQETAWGSIGTILTAIQIREATERDVVVPWNKWEPETFKTVETLHAADRGGFIMDPVVGVHEDVVEVDFSSLYPMIMCEYNISPETIQCACHPDRDILPELPYAVCPERGFLVDVLEPLLADREEAKQAIRAADTDADCRDARAISGAIKWILVSCFGYQGYRNAKFGRIECHEAINAVARDIFLQAKETFEANGWDVIHGIVDSIWVTPDVEREQTSIETLTERIGTDVGIPLDFEASYEWVAFVPRRGTSRGALTRYMGKRSDGTMKLRGIEARQRSTPPFIADVQRELLDVFDETRDPAAVIDRVVRHSRALHAGAVPADALVCTTRVSKPLEAYQQETVAVAALRRTNQQGMPKQPGQSVQYVVVDDDASGKERVRLAVEAEDDYDAAYYEEHLLRAAESVVSPLGWDRERIDRYRRNSRDVRLTAYQ